MGSPAVHPRTPQLAGLTLLASFTLVVLATAYCLYNGIRPAKMAFPAALTMLICREKYFDQ